MQTTEIQPSPWYMERIAELESKLDKFRLAYEAEQADWAKERAELALRLDAALGLLREIVRIEERRENKEFKRQEYIEAWGELYVRVSAFAVEKGEPWKCGECGQEFGEQIDLALHMSAKHRV